MELRCFVSLPLGAGKYGIWRHYGVIPLTAGEKIKPLLNNWQPPRKRPSHNRWQYKTERSWMVDGWMGRLHTQEYAS